jgi:hypothetical protein
MIALYLTGCVAGTVQMYPATPAHERVFSYSYESVQRAQMGAPMVYRIDGRVGEGFATAAPFQPEQDGDILFSRIETGSDWLVIGRTRTNDLVCKSYAYPKPMKGDDQVPWDFCLIVSETGEPYGYAHCKSGEIVVRPWPRKPYNFLKRYSRVFHKGTFRQEIVYENRLHTKVTLVYREYRDDLKRPIVSQSYLHDLSQSNIVSIRGMRLEILEATPENIRFIVKTPFDDIVP